MTRKKSIFDFNLILKRAIKVVKKKHGVKLSVAQARKIWKDYAQFGIVFPVAAGKKVQVDDYMSVEVVGRRIIDDKRLFNLLSKGMNITAKGNKIKATQWATNRPGLAYKIEVKDKNYKGKLIFEADEKLKKEVRNKLKNTQQYFRIEL